LSGVDLPDDLTILALDGTKDEALAAKVVAHQLWETHQLRLVVELLPVHDLSRSLFRGEYQILVLPVPSDPQQLFESFAGILDEGSDRLEEAVAHSDWQSARNALVEEAVLIPLWNQRNYAAVDKSICGAQPDSATSWLWLGNLLLCEGELP
jgi:hypothetical protein